MVKRCLLSLFFCFGVIAARAAPPVTIEEAQALYPDGATYTPVSPAQTLDFKMFPFQVEDHERCYQKLPQTYVFSLKDGHVGTENGISFIEARPVKELIWPWSRLNMDHPHHRGFDLEPLKEPELVKGRLLVLSQEGANNYYHWMTEVLPKLALIEKANIGYDAIYLRGEETPFMRETLAMMGVDLATIIPAWPKTHVVAETLVLPSFASLSTFTPRWVVDYLRLKLMKNLGPAQFPQKIFISRKKAHYRRLLNEDGVFSLYEDQGHTRFFLEGMTVAQKINLFAHASQIVAAHGAGLTNLLFCKEGTKVIEIFQEHKDTTYWYLSQVLRLSQQCVKTTAFKEGGGYTDTTVDLSVLRTKLEEQGKYAASQP